MFTNKIHIIIQSGNGGHGCESFAARTDKKFVTDGGNGARGGRIIFRADNNAPPIRNFRFRQHIIAESGGHGGPNHRRGKSGRDEVVLVPVGTSVYDRERNFLIRELVRSGDEVVALEGGAGGSGNVGGKKKTLGEPGGVLDVELHFRIQADIFLVGLPNSGKSSLLNDLTRTHLKTEPYPFCTRMPEIGVFTRSDYGKTALCELPSLYEGSLQGGGAGVDFLLQLQNAKFIFYVVDALSEFSKNVTEGFQLLRDIVGKTDENFLQVPHAVIITKIDLKDSETRLKAEPFAEKEVSVFPVSTVTGKGIKELKKFLEEGFTAEGYVGAH